MPKLTKEQIIRIQKAEREKIFKLLERSLKVIVELNKKIDSLEKRD